MQYYLDLSDDLECILDNSFHDKFKEGLNLTFPKEINSVLHKWMKTI